MIPDPTIELARGSGLSVAEYLDKEHRNRQRRMFAAADKARREAIAMERQRQREAEEQKRVKQRISWQNMVAMMIAKKEKDAADLDKFIHMPRHSLNEIMREITIKYGDHGVTIEDLKSKRKPIVIALARTEYYWRARRETSHSLTSIGRNCGGKDHTTVLYGVGRYESLQRMKAGLIPIEHWQKAYANLWDLIIPLEAPNGQ